jgi:hypothetical protein
MKNKLKIIFGIAAIVAGTAFSFFSSPSLPEVKTPQPPGTLILRKQLVFAGYSSPEATLETVYWAIVNGNYDAAIASAPKDEAVKVYGENLKQFKSEWQNSEYKDFVSLQIFARKNVSADRVELEFHELLKDQTDDESAPGIATMIKVGNEWKFNFETVRDYTTNWESADVIIFVERTNAPDARKEELSSGIFISAKQLTNAGYSTPEATVETETWAAVNKKDDELSKTYSPEMQEKLKGRPAHEEFIVELGHSKFDPKKVKITFVELMIPAKKIISDDTVELKTAKMERQSTSDGEFVGGSFWIQQLVKTGDEWKINAERFYDKNWDEGSQPEPTVHR